MTLHVGTSRLQDGSLAARVIEIARGDGSVESFTHELTLARFNFRNKSPKMASRSTE